MKKTTKKETKPAARAVPVIAKGSEKAILDKLVRAATTYDEAWQAIRKTFPRTPYGKVRAIVQRFSEYKTLGAQFSALHGKKPVAKKAAA